MLADTHMIAELSVAVSTVTGLPVVWAVRRMRHYCSRWQSATAQAHRSERRYLAVIDDLTDVIMRYSGNGKLVFANDAFCRLTGQSRAQLIGTPWSDYPVAEDVPLIAAQNENLTLESPIATVECRFRSQDGDIRWVQLVNHALFDTDGHLYEVQSVGRDVTSHRRLEEALEQARSAAEQANEFKSRFLAAASHDLRQPLQTIGSVHSLLSRSLADGPHAAHLTLLDDAVRAMDETLGALMDINRLEKGAIVPMTRDFALHTTLDRLRAEFSLPAAAKGLAFSVEECDAVVRGDPMLLAVILRNLVANAVKYTNQGGVRVRAHRQGSRLRLDVEDSGVGIAAEHLPRVFDPFYQVERSTLDQRRGVGLGLSIVHSLCKLLGHEVTVESTVGRGSTFRLDMECGAGALPAAAPAPAAAVAAMAPRGGRILHIEDDPGVARSMGLLLGLEGFTISHAASRDDAVHQIHAGFRPDLILCDFHLPFGQTGDQIVCEIAEILGRKPPTIVLTGDISDRQIEKARSIADSILPKPVDIDVLLRRFDELMAPRPVAHAPSAPI